MSDQESQQDQVTQRPPELGNQYRDDPLLAAWLHRVLPEAVMAALQPELDELGKVAGGDLYALQLADRGNEPQLKQWNAWGNRVDEVELTPRMWSAAR